MKQGKICLLVFSLAALLVPSAQAQWAVFDATNFANAVKEFKQLQQMYTTANQTRDQVIQAYNLAYQMSKMPQNLASRYQSTFSQWTTLSSSNTYGNTSAWIDALNLGGGARATSAYNSAVVPVQSYPSSSFSSHDSTTQATIKNQYATSELSQATITNSLSTLGTIRSDSQSFTQKLSNLEADTYSTDSSQQTQMAVLGKINTATLLQIHSQQNTNQLLAASVAQQALAEKQRADEQNRLINQSIYFQQNFATAMQHVGSGVSTTIHSISLSTN